MNFIRLHTLLLLLAMLISASAIAQSSTPYTSYQRYNTGGQLTGEIMPATLGTTSSYHQARRYTYDAQGLLIRTDVGVLQKWLDESIFPAQWEYYAPFEIAYELHASYDSWGRRILARTIKNGQVLKLVQYNYYDSGKIKCEAVRMNPAVYSALPDACSPGSAGVDGPDRITRYTYQNLDYIVKIEKAVGTAAAQTYVRYEYGAANRLKSETDANGNRTELTYDGKGRLQRMTFPSPTAQGSVNSTDYEEYTYDTNSNRTRLRKRDGRSITYEYDALNRVAHKTPPVNEDIYYEYNNLGLQTYARFGYDATKGVRFGYDRFGRLIAETDTTSGSSFTVSQQIDEGGLVNYITYPDGKQFYYFYDGIGQFVHLRDGNAGLVGQSYTNNGLPHTRTNFGASTTTTLFDESNRLGKLTHDFAGTTNDVNYDFRYNPASQLTRMGISNNLYLPRLSSFIGQTTFTANGLNQYTGTSVNYDLNGNLTKSGSVIYGYDGENRLTTVGTQPLKYDALGRLHEYQANGTTTRFVYLGNTLIGEYDTNGTLLKRYVHAPGGEAPLVSYTGSDTSPASRQFLHLNHQGSVIAISDANGNIVARNTYDEYGIPGTANQGRFGYTGQVYLKEYGFYYYKARIYSPWMGRFLQTDPIGYADNMNLYAYTGNDPVNKIDPSGMAQCGKSLTGENCEKALDDADAARDNAKTAAEGLKGVAGRMKDGKLTDADNAALKVVEQRFGKNFTTEKGLGKLAKGIEGAANKIGARGEGAVLQAGNNKKLDQPAYASPLTGTIYLNNSYFDQKHSMYREQTMVHEGAHLNGAIRDKYINKGDNPLYNDTGLFGAYSNADTYGCAVYPSVCGF